jgi:hypothetical protein
VKLEFHGGIEDEQFPVKNVGHRPSVSQLEAISAELLGGK